MGASILRVKDAEGNVISVPAIKGDKGDTYVLTEADKKEISAMAIIDQHFTPTSPNAQSGIAVAEAVSGKADKKEWVLLNDITLTEVANDIKFNYGAKYYKELWVEAVFKFETDYTSAKTALFSLGARSNGTIHTEYWSSITNGREERFKGHCYTAPSGSLETDTFHSNSHYLANTPKTTAFTNRYDWSNGFDQCRLNLIEEGGAKGIRFGVGSTIKVWGLEQ